MSLKENGTRLIFQFSLRKEGILMKILIVEDDRNIARLLSEELKAWAYKTYEIRDFSKVVEEVEVLKPDLILMDISLPFFNGFYWTQEIRKKSKVPIIFISSHTESMDIIQAMNFGADDYITKPIDIAVTRAKIQAVLRRSYDYKIDSNILEFGDVYLDLSKASISFGEETTILTRTELMILESLFESKGDIVMREDIIEKCWQDENFIDDNTLAVNITRLRKKLRQIGKANLIQTKKGMGYFLEARDE